MRGAGQHQRHQRLVDEHRVGLVDQRDVRVRRHQIVDVGDQLVAQHVEADLVDRGVGDVALVGLAPLVGRRVCGDPADGHAERLEQRAHPFGVAAGQVVVDRDDVHVAAAERVARRSDRARQRLALTGRHLDHVAGKHPQRAQQLDVERLAAWWSARPPRGRWPGTAGCPPDSARSSRFSSCAALRSCSSSRSAAFSSNSAELRTCAIERAWSLSVLAPSSFQNRLLTRPEVRVFGLRHTVTVRGPQLPRRPTRE